MWNSYIEFIEHIYIFIDIYRQYDIAQSPQDLYIKR